MRITTYNNHLTGQLANDENSTNTSLYQTRREQIHKMCNDVGIYEALEFLNDYIKSRHRIFKKDYPKHYELYLNDKLFLNENTIHFDKPPYQLASFIEFLIELKSEKDIVLLYKTSGLPWKRDFIDFKRLYAELSTEGIVDDEFENFLALFASKKELTFNLTLFNLTKLFKKLIELNCISEVTLFSMIDNELLISNKGKKRLILNRERYRSTKSKNNNPNNSKSESKELISAISNFETYLNQSNQS